MDWKKMANNIFANMSKALIDKAMLTILAREAKNIIYKRTKSGYGVSNDSGVRATKIRLKSLSTSYKAWRKGSVAYWRNKNGSIVRVDKKQWSAISPPRLGKFGSPTRSNLTLSGQMLEAMLNARTKNSFDYFEITIPNSRRSPIRRADGSGIPQNLSNAEVAEYVSTQGRPFFALTVGEQRILNKQYKDLLLRKLRLALK
jgi:hypothetical protein